MRKQNHTLGQRLMAYILLFSLLLQNCNNPAISLDPHPTGSKTKDPLPATSTTFPRQRPLQVSETPTDLLQGADDQQEQLHQGLDSSLEGARSTADQSDKPQIFRLPANQLAKATKLRPTHLSPSKSNPKLARNKPAVNSLAERKWLAKREQARSSVASSAVVKRVTQPTKQADEEVATQQITPSPTANGLVSSHQVETSPSMHLVTKGRYQIAFERTSEGPWKASVHESFQVGISRRMELPVFFELGYNLSHVANSHLVHMVHQDGGSFIWVGTTGIKGGMHQEEEDDNNNRNSSKPEEIPSDLSGKLKYLYQADDTLPRLIEVEDKDEEGEGEEEKIPVQKIQDYYVKLQVVLQEDAEKEKSAAARDQVVGEKKPMEVEKLFDEIDQDHPAVGKVLLLGGAGIGKSTLMHYISHQWANGKLWKDRYEHVFRVRLKDMLNPDCLKDYTREEKKKNLLACFVHSCLENQKMTLKKASKKDKIRNQQIKGLDYDLAQIGQLLEDPSKKEKVLLLVDGYDEIASLNDKTKYGILEEGVFEHPHVIMTSRPHAAKKDVRGKFARKVESQGLDEAGISRYVDLNFKKEPALAESLKAFLFTSSQVRSMCEVPINTALLCIIWKDPAVREKFADLKSMQADLKLGELYQELIVWLGKRYAMKYGGVQDIDELSVDRILDERPLKALELIAYKAFTGQLGNQHQSNGVLGIPGGYIDKVAREVDAKLSISELHKYGLLKGEGDPNKPLAQTYYFIHLTFQEYLAATHLHKLLIQEGQVKEVATWLAHHRNEPKYLMTFKFLAGLVSQSKDERLVRSFWEAMSCNVDGVIELGVEGKVNLFLHLLSQSKVGGQFDGRIPNLAQIAKLVDNTLQGDLVRWHQQIIETSYFPKWLIEAVSQTMQSKVKLASQENLSEKDRMYLQTAAELLSKMVQQGEHLNREQLFDWFMRLVKTKDWHLQRLGLEKARDIADKSIPARKLEESAKAIVYSLADANLEKATTELLAKLCQITQPVFKHLIPLLADNNKEVRKSAAGALQEIVSLVPELGKEGMEALKPLLSDSNEEVRKSAASGLQEIVSLVPGFGKEVLESLKPLLADSDVDVRKSAASGLKKIVSLVPELGKEGMEALKSLLSDSNEDIRKSVAHTLQEIVKLVPKLGKEGIKALKPLLDDSNYSVESSATSALQEIVKLVPGKEVLEALKPLLSDNHQYVRRHAVEALQEIVKSDPELGKEVWESLTPLLADKHEWVRWHAVKALGEIVKLVPELGKEGIKALKPLLADSNYSVESSAASALEKIMPLVSKLGKEGIESLKPLLGDNDKYVRRHAVEALQEIVKSEPGLGKEVLKALKPLLADSYEWVRSRAPQALVEIVRSVPGLGKEVLEALSPLLADSDKDVRRSAADSLKKIMPLVPKLGKEGVEALTPLLADSDKGVRKSAADSLKEIVKLVPERGLETLKPLLADKNKDVRSSVAAAVKEIALLVPGKEVLEVLKPLLADSYEWVRERAVAALKEIALLVPGKEVCEASTPLLGDSNHSVRCHAAVALQEIVKSDPGLGKEVLEALKPPLADSDHMVRSSAAEALKKILQLVPELEKEGIEALKSLLAHRNKDVRKSAIDALKGIVKLVPERGKEVWEALKPLVADNHEWVRSDAVNALEAVMQSAPELRKEGFEALKPLLADSYEYVRSSAAGVLKEIALLVPGFGKEVCEALKSLLADSHEFVRKSAVDALKEIVPLVPELAKEVCEALIPLLAGEDLNVRIRVATAFKEIVPLVPGFGKEVWKALKPLLAYRNEFVQSDASHALIEIVPLVPELGKEVIEAFKPLLDDGNEYIRKGAVDALRAIVKSVPELSQEVLKALKPLLADSDEYVRSCAADALRGIGPLVPELGKEVLEALKPLLADSDDGVQSGATEALIEIVKLVPGFGKEVLETLRPLLADGDEYIRRSAVDPLREIVSLMPELAKEVWEALKPLLVDEDEYLRSNTAYALGIIVKSMLFAEQVSLLTDANPEVRNQAKEALVATLKSPAAIAQLDHQAMGSLLEIIRENKDQQEELAQALYRGATKALASIADRLNPEGLAWLHSHLGELPNLPDVQAFLKALIHHTLQDKMLDLQEAELLIKCIVERGLTAIIDPQSNQIILEDITYALDPACQANLNHVVNEVIRLSKDPIAQQYKEHKPLFKNSGEALPLATADIDKAGSIVDKTELASDSWHVSVMDLSDHHQTKPSASFILLEQRNYAGQHVIHQVKVDKGECKIISQAINPLEVDKIREEVFGKLEYIISKPRYYGVSFSLSQELGEKLLEAAQQIKPVADAYLTVHELAGDYRALQGNQNRTASDLLSLPWKEYSKHPEVREYKKEEILAIEASQVRRESIFIASQEQIEENKKEIASIHQILEIGGVKEDAQIKSKLLGYQAKEKELFAYCTSFIWTLKAYMDAYLVGSSGLLATNQEGSKVEEVAYKTGRNAVSAAVNLIPFVGGFVASMLTDALDMGRDAIKQAKQDNKIAAINALLTKNHALPSELEKSIAQAALKIAERKKSIIITPPVVDKSRLGELGDKVSALTDKLLKNHQIGQSPQAELAVKDVVALMIRLYQEYELANENRSKADFPTQLAELVCVGSLEDMVAQSANKLDISLVSGVFKSKTLQKLQEKASKGLWKSTRLKRGKECEAYLKEAYIKEYLTKKATNPVAVSKETISASRAVLFEALCKGMVATKEKKPASVLVCAQAFAQAYPSLTKQIAADYPTYFMDRQIAAECIKDDPALLAAVQSKLPPVSRFQ